MYIYIYIHRYIYTYIYISLHQAECLGILTWFPNVSHFFQDAVGISTEDLLRRLLEEKRTLLESSLQLGIKSQNDAGMAWIPAKPAI